jgi:hypothetical protein
MGLISGLELRPSREQAWFQVKQGHLALDDEPAPAVSALAPSVNARGAAFFDSHSTRRLNWG